MSLASKINKLSNSKDFTTAFGNALDLALKTQNQPRTSRPNIKPSKAGCIRQMYYILSETQVSRKEKVDPNMTLIQKEGSAMHLILQRTLLKAKDQGIDLLDPASVVYRAQEAGIRTLVRPSTHDADDQFEVTCYNEDYDISFKFDGAVRFMNKTVILEIKNEDHFKWLRRTREEPEHVFQAIFYSLCLGIDWVLFIYVGRNYKQRKYYLVEITPEMRQEQINRIKIAKICTARNIAPSKTKHKGCNYCSYKTHCKNDGEGGHEGKITQEEIDNYDIREA